MAHTIIFTSQPLICCTCGGIPMETTAKKCLMTGVADTVAAGEGHWTTHPIIPDVTNARLPIITMHSGTTDDSFPALIEGHPSEIATVLLEVTEAVDLSELTSCKVIMIGR